MTDKKRVYDNYGGYVDFVPEEAGIMTETCKHEFMHCSECCDSDHAEMYREIERLRGDIRVASQAYSKKSEEAAAEIDRLRGELQLQESFNAAFADKLKEFGTIDRLIEEYSAGKMEVRLLNRALTVAKGALIDLRKFSHFSVCRFVQTDGVKPCDCPKGIVDGALKHLDETP